MKALVVDDDRVLADLVAFALRHQGFEVVQAHDGEAALRRWTEEQPELVVLDVNLPKIDGFTVCRRIRAQADDAAAMGHPAIIMLTVRSEEDDLVRGLELGADDYIAKPFSPRQLVARAHAVLRRAGKAPVPSVRQVGDLTLDPSRREVRVAHLHDESGPVALTPLECRLLDYLMANAGRVLTTESIIDYVWGPEGGDRDMVRQLMRRLRAKIEPDPARPAYIETVSGLGYGLRVS